MIGRIFIKSIKKNDFSYTERTSTLYKKSRIWEGQFVDVFGPSIKNKITIANIYRPPRNNNNLEALTNFTNQIKPCFEKLKRENTYTFVTCDANINLLKVESDTGVSNFFEFLV